MVWDHCLSVGLTLVYCGQMVGWIKMSLGTEVNLGPGHIVLDVTRRHLVGRSSPYCGAYGGDIDA